MAHGNDVFVAISNTVTDVIVYNRTGKQWVTTNLPSSAPLKIYILLMVNLLLYVKMTTEFFTVPNGSSWTQTSILQAQQMTDPPFQNNG